MIPIVEIKEGDMFSNPLFQDVVYRVERVNEKERLVLVQPHGGENMAAFMRPFWKSNKDRLFSESWMFCL